jgi:hypothetical protein
MMHDDILVGDQRNLPAELPLSDSEGNEPLPLGWSELREEFVSIQLSKKRHRSGVGKAARSLAFYSVETVRYSVGAVLLVLSFAFLIVFGLHFPHPLAWDSWEVVVLLRQTVRPLLVLIDSVLKWPIALPVYPLVLAILCVVTQTFINSKLYAVSSTINAPKVRKPSAA